MKLQFTRLVAAAAAAALCFTTQASLLPVNAVDQDLAVETLDGGITISAENISTENNKDIRYNNPVSSEFFCADPTSVEYNGRLYLFGTNDHQQYEIKGAELDNTYEQIKSLVVLSTDDMVNWIYHGEIHVDEVAPWIMNSWAPSVVSRVEDDGLTHVYLYFSNNGTGTGVITATDPLGPWSDPLGRPLVTSSTPGLSDCPNPFDPGAVIDENGVGWLAFGGGKASDGTDYMPGSTRIVQLGEDMISFASDFAEIPAPYFFEASELNYINGTYVYTYNSDWNDHAEQWEYDCPVPSGCSMVYMTTKTPLDSDSWEMKGEYFINPGTAGFDYSNNHTHLHKYQGEYYIFYHTLMLKRGMGINGSYRSMNVDRINVDEETVTIEKIGGTKKGVSTIDPVDPFVVQSAAELNNTAAVTFDTSDMHHPLVSSKGEGSWFSVRDVEFTASETPDEPEEPITLDLTAVDTIRYNITVTSVDKPTTVSMHPADQDGVDCAGSVDITGPSKYSITCDLGGAQGLMNMGYFTAADDTLITFVIDTITVNDQYEFDLSAELTNTREWADGLKNIWNGFTDGDAVYSSEYAVFRYVGDDDAIKLYAAQNVSGGNDDNAPLVEQAMTFYAKVKGTGRVEIRLDAPDGAILTSVDFDSPGAFSTIYNTEVAQIGGTHDLYFVCSAGNITVDAWQFAKSGALIGTVQGDVNADGAFTIADVVMLQKYIVNDSALTDWKAGDLFADKKINVLDLAQMKQNLMGK